jgi:hypothetical protein
MENENDLSSTVIAKSDQLNADDFTDPIVIVVTRVDKVSSKDQPVLVHSEGRQPFKPCLTMRRMLIAAWGKYKDEWVGRSMTLYCDDEVLWAGKAHGGIRVSHVSNIDAPVSKMLAVTRGRKKLFALLPLVVESKQIVEKVDAEAVRKEMSECGTFEGLKAVFGPAYKLARELGDSEGGKKLKADYINYKKLGGWE